MKIAFVINDKRINLMGNEGCKLQIFNIINNLRKRKCKVKIIQQKNNSNFVLRSIKLALKCKGSDLIHERYSLYSIAGFLASRIFNTPLIVDVDAPLPYEVSLFWKIKFSKFQEAIINLTSKITLNQAKAVTTVSEETKAYLIKKWGISPNKIFVIPNGVKTDIFSKKFNEKKIRENYNLKSDIVIMFVGSLKPWSGINNLIKSFYEAKKNIKKIKLFIVGGGEEKNDIENEISKLGLEGSVILTGNVPHQRIPELLSFADIAVLPYSRIKNFYFSPLKLFEYMAARKAIIASDQGQISRTIKHGETGILFEPGNIKELSEAIISLSRNKKKRLFLGKKAFLDVKGRTWGSFTRKLLEVYNYKQ